MACGVQWASTQPFRVERVSGSREIAGAVLGIRTRNSSYYKELSGRCIRPLRSEHTSLQKETNYVASCRPEPRDPHQSRCGSLRYPTWALGSTVFGADVAAATAAISLTGIAFTCTVHRPQSAPPPGSRHFSCSGAIGSQGRENASRMVALPRPIERLLCRELRQSAIFHFQQSLAQMLQLSPLP